jgi:putative heme iron utilization protein
MADRPDPVQPADDAARTQARDLLAGARFGALAFVDAETGTPGISRIAVGRDDAGLPVTLISSLSSHHSGLRAEPVAALMVGEPDAKGDPLTHPRLMIRVRASFLDRADPGHAALRARWLTDHPKAKLYVDFGDFGFVRLTPLSALLNGGFGRAVRLTTQDLGDQAPTPTDGRS